MKKQITKDRLKKFNLEELNKIYNYIFNNHPVTKSGTGLTQIKNSYDLGKFYLDKNKFDNDLLELRYKKNKHIAQIKPMYLSGDLKKVVKDLIHNKTINNTDYEKLSNIDKNTIRVLNHKLGFGLNINHDDTLDKRFEIIRGEILAGNTNLSLKKEAKQYLLHALRIGKLPRNVCYDLMMELDL